MRKRKKSTKQVNQLKTTTKLMPIRSLLTIFAADFLMLSLPLSTAREEKNGPILKSILPFFDLPFSTLLPDAFFLIRITIFFNYLTSGMTNTTQNWNSHGSSHSIPKCHYVLHNNIECGAYKVWIAAAFMIMTCQISTVRIQWYLAYIIIANTRKCGRKT